MKCLRGQKLCSRFKSNRIKERKSQCADLNIIYKYNILGREGEIRVLMNILNSSFKFENGLTCKVCVCLHLHFKIVMTIGYSTHNQNVDALYDHFFQHYNEFTAPYFLVIRYYSDSDA